MDVISQLQAMFITIIAGMLLGLVFDFYRVLRGLIRPRGWLSSLGDLLYWLVATAVVFTALLLGNWGELRLYAFLSLLAGVGAYYRLCSVFAVRTLLAALRLSGRLTATLYRCLVLAMVQPLWFIVRLILWSLRWVGRLLRQALRSTVSGVRCLLFRQKR